MSADYGFFQVATNDALLIICVLVIGEGLIILGQSQLTLSLFP
jgi:hypothetical protein